MYLQIPPFLIFYAWHLVSAMRLLCPVLLYGFTLLTSSPAEGPCSHLLDGPRAAQVSSALRDTLAVFFPLALCDGGWGLGHISSGYCRLCVCRVPCKAERREWGIKETRERNSHASERWLLLAAWLWGAESCQLSFNEVISNLTCAVRVKHWP